MNRRTYYYLLPVVICLAFECKQLFAQAAEATSTGKHYTSFDGVKIYYEVHGNGFPVLLVHGFISDGQTWKGAALYTDLIQAGYQVIVPDMRGNGKSDKPHTAEAYERDAEARDLMGLMSSLKIEKFHLVGYSRGAIIASRLLVLDSRIAKAVLGGMGADFTNPEWPRRKLFYRALTGESVPELEGVIKRIKENQLDQLALAYLQKAQPSTSHQELAEITQPVLVISGDKDNDNGSAEALGALIKSSKTVSVPGEHGNTRISKQFSQEVLRFLQ